tara:strand:+ start:1073 stop:1738 length:666 start_codon:yes stop_codon:yes gene_type:complete
MQVSKDNKNIILLIIFFLFLTSYQIKKINIFTFFKVNEVEFIGSKNFEENLKDDLTNSLNNKSLFNITKKEISNIVKKSQWIESYKIKKKYPKKISIIFFEYKPVATFQIESKSFLINNKFKLTNKLANFNNDLIQITGEYRPKQFQNIYNIIIKSEIYKKVKIIKFYNLKRWDIYLKNNALIKFGNHNITEQIHILESIIKKYKDFYVIDLRNKGNVIIK